MQGWVKHFPPPWAVKAELVHMVKQAPGARTFGVDESDVANGSIMLYEGEGAAAVLLLAARELLRGPAGVDSMSEAAAVAGPDTAA